MTTCAYRRIDTFVLHMNHAVGVDFMLLGLSRRRLIVSFFSLDLHETETQHFSEGIDPALDCPPRLVSVRVMHMVPPVRPKQGWHVLCFARYHDNMTGLISRRDRR